MPLPASLKLFSDLEEIEDIFGSSEILFGNKTADKPRTSRQSRTKSGIIKCINYKNSKKLGEAMSVL